MTRKNAALVLLPLICALASAPPANAQTDPVTSDSRTTLRQQIDEAYASVQEARQAILQNQRVQQTGSDPELVDEARQHERVWRELYDERDAIYRALLQRWEDLDPPQEPVADHEQPPEREAELTERIERLEERLLSLQLNMIYLQWHAQLLQLTADYHRAQIRYNRARMVLPGLPEDHEHRPAWLRIRETAREEENRLKEEIRLWRLEEPGRELPEGEERPEDGR